MPQGLHLWYLIVCQSGVRSGFVRTATEKSSLPALPGCQCCAISAIKTWDSTITIHCAKASSRGYTNKEPLRHTAGRGQDTSVLRNYHSMSQQSTLSVTRRAVGFHCPCKPFRADQEENIKKTLWHSLHSEESRHPSLPKRDDCGMRI